MEGTLGYEDGRFVVHLGDGEKKVLRSKEHFQIKTDTGWKMVFVDGNYIDIEGKWANVSVVMGLEVKLLGVVV